ncbi:hypothetical protein Fot_47498 [Forsythia ovata]|uniref:Uncharacterized protein n=1 Tax=Forsythia ovata TaxID=205694 RepID=A0ABD1QRF6_9LAMI
MAWWDCGWYFPSAFRAFCGVCSGECHPAGARDNGEQSLFHPIGARSNIRGVFRSVSCGTSESFKQSGKKKACTDSKKEAFRTSVPPPTTKCEYINIGSRRDDLDPTFLGKMAAPISIAAVSVHKV